MSCGRAAEVDLAGFAADPRAAEWNDFRAHYPRCADCSREVAIWARLRSALEEAMPSDAAHPNEEDLLAFASQPARLPAARRSAIEAHVGACAMCRTELAVLREFDFAALGAPTPEAQPASKPSPGWADRLAAFAQWLSGPARQPAFALAAALLVAIPIGVAVWRNAVTDGAPDAPPIAHEEIPSRPPQAAPSPEAPATQIAEEVAPPPAPAERAVEPPSAPAAQKSQIARDEPARTKPDPAPRDAGGSPRIPRTPAPPALPARSEPASIAALLPEEAPEYRPQLVLAGGSFASVRRDTAVRGGGAPLPAIRALGPEHVGATQMASPTLYWHLAAESRVPVELTLVSERGAEPLLELQLGAPVAAGLHSLNLAERGIALQPGVTYRWFATLVPDADRRDRDVASGAAVRRAPADADLTRQLADGGPAQRAHQLAEAGYWYDAFDALSQIAEAAPDAPRPAAQRAALLEQVGLGEVASRLARE